MVGLVNLEQAAGGIVDFDQVESGSAFVDELAGEEEGGGVEGESGLVG